MLNGRTALPLSSREPVTFLVHFFENIERLGG
jgi:hypothetical protein